MNTCPICYENQPLITAHHYCQFCEECLFTWLKVLSQHNKKINADSTATCPTEGCEFWGSFRSLSSNLSEAHKVELNDTYFRNYVLHKSDILQCPNSSCSYAGFMIPFHFGCHAPFECKNCGYQWMPPLARGSTDSVWQRFSTFIVKEFTSKRCPSCHTYIERIGGCDTITCAACGKSFPWLMVVSRGWFTLFLCVVIPSFALVCHNYRGMIDTSENSWIATMGVWALHIVLVNLWLYLLMRYVVVYGELINRYVLHRKKRVIAGFAGTALPIGSLVGLSCLMPGYFGYWRLIAFIEGCLTLIIVLTLASLWVGTFLDQWNGKGRKRLRKERHVRIDEQSLVMDESDE